MASREYRLPSIPPEALELMSRALDALPPGFSGYRAISATATDPRSGVTVTTTLSIDGPEEPEHLDSRAELRMRRDEAPEAPRAALYPLPDPQDPLTRMFDRDPDPEPGYPYPLDPLEPPQDPAPEPPTPSG
jgi:hypothetical protein